MKNKEITLSKSIKEICKNNEYMSEHTSFKIGGQVLFFFEPKNCFQIKRIIKFCNYKKIPFEVVGNGTNILFSSLGYNGAIIKIGKNFKNNQIIFKKKHKNKDILKKNIFFYKLNKIKTFFVGAGVPISMLSMYCLKNSLSGLEFAVSIPGTIGGAIYMNAGAFNESISKVIKSVLVLNKNTLQKKWLKNEECMFSYRKSIFQNNKNYIILGAKISLKKGSQEFINEKMIQYKQVRMTTQNVGYPSAGSVFKKMDNFIPAKFFDEQNLKGLRVGNVQLSKVHSGYIVNLGGAKSDDVIKLIDILSKKVLQIKNYMLELEIEKMGDFHS